MVLIKTWLVGDLQKIHFQDQIFKKIKDAFKLYRNHLDFSFLFSIFLCDQTYS